MTKREKIIAIMRKVEVGSENGHRVLAEAIWLPRVFEKMADALILHVDIAPTCKDCFHDDVCGCRTHEDEICSEFKNKENTVEVVRCKDCKYRHSSEFCECREEDAFCSDGERKEDEK